MKRNTKIKIFTTVGVLSLLTTIVTPIVMNMHNNSVGTLNNYENKSSSSSVENDNHISLVNYNTKKNNRTVSIQTTNNEVLNWYISSNSNLSNDLKLKPISIKNNIVTLMVPQNYKGDLYYFAKDKSGSYTNSVKINVNSQNSNYKYINVGVLGDKSPMVYHYKISNNSPELYSLSTNNSLVTTTPSSTGSLIFYYLSNQYESFFNELFNYISSKNVISSLNFNDFSTSTNIYLESILSNWSNFSITQINFINSNNYSYNIPQNWNNVSFEGLQLIITNKSNSTEEYTIGIPANIFILSFNQSYIAGIYGNSDTFSPLFQNLNDQSMFLSDLEDNNYNSNLLQTSSFSSINSFLSSLISSINLTNIPTTITSTIKDNLNSLYYQSLAYKILANQEATTIKNSNELYPGSEFNVKNFPWTSIGYINSQWGQDAWLMGWSKYSQILNESGYFDVGTPLNIGFQSYEISNDFSYNMFSSTPWSNLPSLSLGSNSNLIYQEILGDSTSLKNDSISPTGILGLMEVNHFLNPNQQEGLAFSNSQWDIFGYSGGWISSSDLQNISNNINKIISGIIELYKIYDLNTIDIDYEYPTGSQYTAMQNYYALFIKRLRNAFNLLSVSTGISYTISATVDPQWSYSYSNWLYQSNDYLNQINLMNYDMITPSSNVAGGNSKLYSLDGGYSTLKDILTGSSTTVTLTNQVTGQTQTLTKIPNYISSSSSIDGAVAGDGIVQYVESLISNGISPSKIILGEAAYSYGWQIKGDGPLTQYPGMFGYLDGGTNYDQPGISSLMNDIENKSMILGFNPYTGNNYAFDPTTHWYWSFDFISSTLAKIEFLKKEHLGGFLVWTMNSQYSPSIQSGQDFNFENSVSASGVISNLPLLATMSGLYSIQDIYQAWKNYLPSNFLSNFASYYNIES